MLADPPIETLLAALPNETLRELAARGSIRRFRRDVIIIQEGDFGDTVYLILAGRAKVFATGDNDREIVLDTHGPGEYIGEMCLDGGTRSASVMTLEPTICAVVTCATLRDHLARHPAFTFELLTKLIRRARRATANVKSLALFDVYKRVATLFETLAIEDNGVRLVPERLTHQEIADRVGASREMVSRLLKDLTQGGYIEVTDRRFVLKKALPSSW